MKKLASIWRPPTSWLDGTLENEITLLCRRLGRGKVKSIEIKFDFGLQKNGRAVLLVTLERYTDGLDENDAPMIEVERLELEPEAGAFLLSGRRYMDE